MTLSHNKLVEYVHKLGYQSSEEGICFGVAHMGIQAILTKDIQSFMQHLDTIKEDIDEDYRLGNLINTENPNKNLTKKDIETLTDIQEFCDGAVLYQSSHMYSHLFKKVNASLFQNAMLTASKINPFQMEQQGGLYQASSFSGVYSKAELLALLQDLEVIATSNQPVALALSNLDHTISVGFDPDKKEWLFIDANSLPPITLTNEEELAEWIMKAFIDPLNDEELSNEKVIINFKAYSTFYNKQGIDNIIDKWKRCSSWINANSVTEEKVSYRDSNNNSWLIMAAEDGHLGVVKELLRQHNIDVNEANDDEFAPLHIAAQNGHLEIVKELLEQPGINVNKKEGYGRTPLHIAAQNGHLDVIKELLNHREIDINEADDKGSVSLHIAVQRGQLDVVKELLNHMDVNQVDNIGITPLHIAVLNGHLEIVKELLNHRNIKVNKKNDDGFTPLDIAEENDHPKIVKALRKQLKDIEKPDKNKSSVRPKMIFSKDKETMKRQKDESSPEKENPKNKPFKRQRKQ